MSKDYDLSHFCDLASRGNDARCSAGEYAAAALARSAYDDYLLLDGSARRGFRAWLIAVEDAPSSCRDEMEAWGYEF